MTEMGKCKIEKMPGRAGYRIMLRERMGWGSPRYAKTRAEAERVAQAREERFAAMMDYLVKRANG